MADATVVVPNAVSAPPELPSRRHAAPGPLTIACVANLIAYKGHADLLAAAALLREAGHADWRLLLIGEGPERAALEAQVEELGLGAHVELRGTCTDVPAVLAEADLSVLPSLTEGMPNAVLESMAAGVPVVATAVGSVPELLGDGVGALVAPGDRAGLAAALGEMIGSPKLRARHATAGWERARREHSADALWQRTFAAFDAARRTRRAR
jgi:glycosyltransferase involved in cell wall biosynthesis